MHLLIFVAITVPFGWKFISKLQKNFVIFTSIDRYIVGKFILAFLIGWAVTPFYILGWIIKQVTSKNSTVAK